MMVFLVSLGAIACSYGLACADLANDQPFRGLVVDRTEKFLWLGLPTPAKKGAVFDIMLVPGSKVIARAVVSDCTVDSPYVARAKFVMEDPSAFIPVGAYAEASYSEAIDDRDVSEGYESIRLGSEKSPWSLKVGIFYPDDKAVRDETRALWPTVEVSYRLARRDECILEAGLGYYQGKGSLVSDDLETKRDIRVLPFTLNVRVKNGKDRDGSYARVGVGAYYVRDKVSAGGAEDKSSVVTFGWQAGLGYESRRGRSVELKYTDVSRTDFRGFVLSFGAKF